jgi:hypothetical protein
MNLPLGQFQDLYSFTLHPNVLNFMKNIPTLTSTLLKMTDIQQDEIIKCLSLLGQDYGRRRHQNYGQSK